MNTLHLKKIDGLLGGGLVRVLPVPGRDTPLPQPLREVLFIRPGGIGDAALLGHTLAQLRALHPDMAVDVLAERRNADVFYLVEGVRHVYLYDRPRDWCRLLRRSYDVVIDSEQWHRLSAVAARLIRSPVKIGFATNERSRMFTHAIAYSLAEDERSSFGRLLEPFGIQVSLTDDVAWLTPPVGTGRGVPRIGGAPPLVVIFPGASIPEKHWGAAPFRTVVRWCLDRGLAVALIGGPAEREEAGLIVEGLPVRNLTGTLSLVETASVLAQASLLVSGDSGVLHMAAGLGRPTLALFGPSSIRKWAPRGAGHVVLGGRLTCSPCSSFGYTPSCPETRRCMRDITVDEVIAGIARLLEIPPGKDRP